MLFENMSFGYNYIAGRLAYYVLPQEKKFKNLERIFTIYLMLHI